MQNWPPVQNSHLWKIDLSCKFIFVRFSPACKFVFLQKYLRAKLTLPLNLSSCRLWLFEDFKSQANLVIFKFLVWIAFFLLKYQGSFLVAKAELFDLKSDKLNLWCMFCSIHSIYLNQIVCKILSLAADTNLFNCTYISVNNQYTKKLESRKSFENLGLKISKIFEFENFFKNL